MSSPAHRRAGKAPPPIHVVEDRRGKVWLESADEDPAKCYATWATRSNRLFTPMKPAVGDRVVKYVPSLPRNAKGARRGK